MNKRTKIVRASLNDALDMATDVGIEFSDVGDTGADLRDRFDELLAHSEEAIASMEEYGADADVSKVVEVLDKAMDMAMELDNKLADFIDASRVVASEIESAISGIESEAK